MQINVATEDNTVSAVLDLPAVPRKDDEIELTDTAAVTTVYTVERVRYVGASGEVWCLLESGKSGGGGGGKKPKKPHPFKDK